jgi:hypothetical protein
MSLSWNKSLLELTGVSLYVDHKLLSIFMRVPCLESFVSVLVLVRFSQRHALPAQTQAGKRIARRNCELPTEQGNLKDKDVEI